MIFRINLLEILCKFCYIFEKFAGNITLSTIYMPRKTARAAKKRDRWIGLFLVELVRATHNGELPVTRQDLISLIGKKYRVSVKADVGYQLIRELLAKGADRSRVWLRTEGHDIYLFSEDETITNSDAIDALFIANELPIDASDCVDYGRWMAASMAASGYTPEMCERFVAEYMICGYAVEIIERDSGEKCLVLNPRNFNRDAFYLRSAREAGLRRRPG
jgi:hypothetical protein